MKQARTYPVGGYQSIQQRTTQQLREERDAKLATKGRVRLDPTRLQIRRIPEPIIDEGNGNIRASIAVVALIFLLVFMGQVL